MGKEKKCNVMRAITIILAFVLTFVLWNSTMSIAAMVSCGIVFYILACLAKESAFLYYFALHIAFWAGGFAFAGFISMLLNAIIM